MSEAGEHPHHYGRSSGRQGAPLLRPTGRWRLAVLLAVVFAAYAGACAFWLYLSTGDWYRLRLDSFIADFTNPVTLPDLFEQTLNVRTHPWMILIGGLVLGTVIFVPILVAVLHRLAVALPLAAVALLAGHAPAMALALAIGCVLASKTRLRRAAPFLAAVVGTLPLVLYIYLFSSAGSSSVAVLPIQRWALKAPYLVAIISAILAFAVLLNLARFTRYRAGIIWPAMAAMLAVPAVLFAWKIGRAELEYQLIAAPLAAGDAVFEPVDRQGWIAARHEQGLPPDRLAVRAADILKKDKEYLQQSCRRFLDRFAASPRAPAVAWVLAQCQSLQLDRPALEQGWVKSTAEYLAPIPDEERQLPARRPELAREAIEAAAAAWEVLRQNYPDSWQAALANWRLAELYLRRLALPGVSPEEANRLPRLAEKRLLDANNHIMSALADWRRQYGASGEAVFVAAPSVPPREYYEQALLKTRRLLWLMERNGAMANPRSAEALGALLQVNSCGLSRQARHQQLYDLAGKYPEDMPMALGLKLALALTQSDQEVRAGQLAELAKLDANNPAAVEAAYELGLLLVQSPQLRAAPDVKTPAEYFRLVRGAPANPWKDLAAERLRILDASGRASPSQPATTRP